MKKDNLIPNYHLKYSILCHLFYVSAQFEIALKYNGHAIDTNGGRDDRGVGAALSNRGMILYKLGRATEALVEFNSALEVFIRIEYSFGVATGYNNVGYVLGQLDRIDEGLRMLEAGLGYIEEHSFREARLCRGYLFKSRGEMRVLQGDVTAAERDYQFALKHFQDGYPPEESEVRMLLGKMYKAMGRDSDGRKALCQALALAEKVGQCEVVNEAKRLLQEG